MSPKLTILAILTPLLLIADQVSKIWAVAALRYTGPPLAANTRAALEQLGHDRENPAEIEVIDGFLSFVHRQNPAAMMGLGQDFEYRMWLFAAFTVVAVVVLVNMYRQLPDTDRVQSLTIALILAGAIGNAIDRLHKQTVTDFIKVYTEIEPIKTWLVKSPLGSNEWPTWNIADACIVVGVALYLLYYLVIARDHEIAAQGPSPLDKDDAAPER